MRGTRYDLCYVFLVSLVVFCFVLSEGIFAFVSQMKERGVCLMICSWQPTVFWSMTAVPLQVLIYQTLPFFCITQAWPDIATAQSVETASWFPLSRGSNNEASISWMAQNSHYNFPFLTCRDYTDNQEVFWVCLLCC